MWVLAWSAGGYGDPIERDPEAGRLDVAAGRVSARWARAREAYGVVVTDRDGERSVEQAATAARRDEIIGERLAGAVPCADDGARALRPVPMGASPTM